MRGKSEKAVNAVSTTHPSTLKLETRNRAESSILDVRDTEHFHLFNIFEIFLNSKSRNETAVSWAARAAITYHDIIAFHQKLGVKRP